MLDKLKQLLSAVGLAKVLGSADASAELQTAKRVAKGLLAGALTLLLDGLLKQVGPDCALGPAACKALQSPLLQPVILSGLLGLDKYLQEKFGLNIRALNTAEPK